MRKLFMALLVLPVVSHAATFEIREKYCHDQKTRLYVPSPHGQAVVAFEGSAPLCYPLPVGRKTVDQGAVSAWVRLSPRGEGESSSLFQNFIIVKDKSQEILLCLNSPNWEKGKTMPDTFLSVFKRHSALYSSREALMPLLGCVAERGVDRPPRGQRFSDQYHHALYTWNSKKAVLYLDGKMGKEVEFKKEQESFDGASLRLQLVSGRFDNVNFSDRFAEIDDVAAAMALRPSDGGSFNFHAGFDGNVTGEAKLEGSDLSPDFTCHVGRSGGLFLKDDKRQLEFQVVNPLPQSKRLALQGEIEDAEGRRWLEHQIDFEVPGNGVKDVGFDLSQISRGGVLWGSFRLKDGEQTLKEEETPFAFTLGVNPADCSPEELRTGFDQPCYFNPPPCEKWSLIWGYSFSGWRILEPSPGVWDFETLDLLVDCLVQSKRVPIFTLAGTPDWQASKFAGDKYSAETRSLACPDDIEAWKDYVRRAGERYKGKVRHYEVWCEPYFCNTTGFGGSFYGTAQQYADLVNAAADVLHGIDPSIQVISGLAGYESFQNTVAKSTAGKANLYSNHPYAALWNLDETLSDLTKRILKENQASPRLCNTEYAAYTIGGAAVFDNGRPMTAEQFEKSGRWDKIDDMRKKNGRDKFVDWHTCAAMAVRGTVTGYATGYEFMLWWSNCVGLFSTLIYDYHTPSPASVAMANASGLLSGYEFVKRLPTHSPDVKVYMFKERKTGGRHLLVAFTDVKDDCVYLRVGDGPLEVRDLYWNDFPGQRIGPVLKLELKRFVPVYVAGLDSPSADSPPVMAIEPFKDKFYPGKPAAFTVKIHNPFDVKLSGTLACRLPSGFAPPADKPFALKPLETASFGFETAVPENAVGVPAMDVVLSADNPGMRGLQIDAVKLPISLAAQAKDVGSQPPVLDGALDEWGPIEAFPIAINKEEQLIFGVSHTRPYVPGVSWYGEKDLSLKAALAYDKENLYVAIRVYDDHLENLIYMEMPPRAYDGDCVELFLDARGKKQGTSAMDGEVYHMKIVPPLEGRPVFCNVSKPPDAAIRGLVIGSKTYTDGYSLELKLPLANFSELKIDKGSVIGLNMAVDDNDEKQHTKWRKSAMAWVKATHDPSSYGRLEFK